MLGVKLTKRARKILRLWEIWLIFRQYVCLHSNLCFTSLPLSLCNAKDVLKPTSLRTFHELSVYDTAFKKKMIWLTTGRLHLGFWIWVISFESEAWWKYSLNLFLPVDWLDSDVSHAAQKQFGWLRHPLNPRLSWQDWESHQLLIQPNRLGCKTTWIPLACFSLLKGTGFNLRRSIMPILELIPKTIKNRLTWVIYQTLYKKNNSLFKKQFSFNWDNSALH